MSGKNFQEDAVLAAVKPLKTANSQSFQEKRTVMANESAAAGSTLEGLFNQHHDHVFRTAYRVTGSAADAEDVLQTVFLRVARGQEAAGEAENPHAYFARAAINASLDLLRSRKRSRSVAIDEVEDRAGLIALAAKENPETSHEDSELRELIREAVSKLGSTAAQMFALRYFEGHGNAEIATIMNTSPLVVGVTLHRARARLRKEIGRYLKRHSSA
jgi:RNA polymerase sigma-70 factor, ECF subfamily